MARIETLRDSQGGREVREARIWGFESRNAARRLRRFRAVLRGSNNRNLAYLSGASTVTLAYGGDPLAAGYYQFRAVSYRQTKNSATRTYISATEDRKGVFIVE